ncbi:MAG: hypothetical protein EXR93_00115 [Gemmatimonadetes bacterium]|nr:hypothetical protein [Gemmatimonadota bacterium]
MVVLVAVVAWMYRRQPILFYSLLLVWVSFVWRLSSSAFIDVAGPIYSIELFRDIGPGRSAVVLVACHLLFIGTLAFVFRHSRLQQLASLLVWSPDERAAALTRLRGVARVAFIAFTVLWVLLYLDMFRIGHIPLFSGIERYIYSDQYAGVFHAFVSKYGIHLSFILGVLFASPAFLSERRDTRFLVLLLVLFAYLLLAGHRFSAYYSHGTSFLIPCALLVLLPRRRPIAESNAPSRRYWVQTSAALMIVGGIVMFAQYRSLFFTRGMDPQAALVNIAERVLILQGGLWWSEYEHVFVNHDWNQDEALEGVLLDPIAPERNTTLPYLMEREIGLQVYPLLQLGVVYTGGYPEVLFELFGPVYGFAAVLVMAYALAKLLYWLMEGILRRQYVRVFLVFYILFPFLLFCVSGMVNSIVNWKFLLKVTAVAIWVLYENGESLGRAPATRRAPAIAS